MVYRPKGLGKIGMLANDNFIVIVLKPTTGSPLQFAIFSSIYLSPLSDDLGRVKSAEHTDVLRIM